MFKFMLYDLFSKVQVIHIDLRDLSGSFVQFLAFSISKCCNIFTIAFKLFHNFNLHFKACF